MRTQVRIWYNTRHSLNYMPATRKRLLLLLISGSALLAQSSQPGPSATGVTVRASAFLSSSADRNAGNPTGGGSHSTYPDLFTGNLTSTLNLTTPSGRHSVQPTLCLVYSGSNSNGWIGKGWSLDFGTIRRNSKNGIDFGANDYVYELAGSSVDLTRIDNGEYRAKIEGTFIRLKQLTSPDGTDYWELTDKKGQRNLFGRTSASQIVDPATPKHIYAWYIDHVQDTSDNFMEFSYTRDQQALYPSEIRYTGRSGAPSVYTIRFILESRTDVENSYAPTFLTTASKRLKAIMVVAGQSVIKAYALSYKYSSNTGRSLLSAIQEYGADSHLDDTGTILGGTALPPRQFLWYDDEQSYAGAVQSANIDWGFPEGRAWVDANGDGRADYCRVVGGGDNQRVRCLLSTGTGFGSDVLSPIIDWGFPATRVWVDVNGDGRADFCRLVGGSGNTRVKCLLSTANGFGEDRLSPIIDWGFPEGRAWVDVNGDGRADYCRVVGGGSNQRVQCLLSTSDGFGEEIQSPVIDWGFPVDRSWVDVNGDGRADYCRVVGGGDNQRVRCLLSTGTGFGQDILSPVIDWGFQGTRAWVDVNGDGKADFCRLVGGDGNSHVSCLLFTGVGFGADILSPNIDWGFPEGRAWVDVNGDGKSDYCRVVGGGSNQRIRCLLSTGHGFGADVLSPILDWGFPGSRSWADFTGDGKTDFCRLVGGGDGSHFVQITPATRFPTDSLKSISNGLGGTTTITYEPSTSYPNTQLPLAIQTVSSLVSNDGLGRISSLSYDYSGGYFYTPDREFRGFHKVIVRGPIGSRGEQEIQETLFHQGNDVTPDRDDPTVSVGYMKGKPYSSRTLDNAGRAINETTTSYIASTAVPYFNPVSQVDLAACDGGPCDKHYRTVFEYDAYGNVVREYDHGDLSTPADDRTIARSYGINEAAWIVGLPATEGLYQGIGVGTQLSGSQYFYDSVSSCSDVSTETIPILGNLTRVVAWTPTGAGPETRMAYDASGNVVCKKDSNGNTTQFQYDATGTLLRFVRDPLGHQTETTYYGIDSQSLSGGGYGLVKSEIDANGVATITEYDAVGRRTRHSAAGDLVWSKWTYANFGSPGTQHILEESSTGLSHDKYLDGFGRTVLERERGPEQKTIVVKRTYDSRGLLADVSVPYYDNEQKPVFKSFAYDAIGRILETTQPDGSFSRRCYHADATVTIDENDHRRREIHDRAGALITVQEYKGTFPGPCTTEELAIPSDGRVAAPDSPVSPPITTPLGPYATTTYDYDSAGNLIGITDSKRNKTTLIYDSLNRRVRVSDPDLGQWLYEYDSNGNLIKQTDALKRVTLLQYDTTNRLVQRDYTTKKRLGFGDVVVEHDKGGLYSTGRTSKIRNRYGSTEYVYDALGRQIKIIRRVSGQSYTTGASYDGDNRPRSITYPDADTVTYVYDGPFLDSVTDKSTVLVKYAGYTAFGSPIEVRFGNGVITKYTFATDLNSECPRNSFRICTGSTTSSDGKVAYSAKYDFDLAGNVTALTTKDKQSHVFAYDEFDRLVAAGISKSGLPQSWPDLSRAISASPPDKSSWLSFKTSMSGVAWTLGVKYDEIGNPTWRSDLGEIAYFPSGRNNSHPHAVQSVGKRSLHLRRQRVRERCWIKARRV
jgi:YD repeat-containing protein